MNSLEHLAMPRGSALRIEDGPGMEIRVHVGSIWLTQEGDARDHYLVAGQCFRLDRAGTALVTALRRTRVSMAALQSERHARRVLLLHAGTQSPLQLYPTARPEGVVRFLTRIGLLPAAS